MAITLRNTKSTPLTFEELDGNFTDLNSRLNTIETTNVTAVNGLSGNITIVTDNINEGSTNLYYTDTRFDTRLATKTTDDLTQGSTNLYYSDSLVDTRIAATPISGLSNVNNDTPSVSDVLTWDGSTWKPAVAPGASGGEANTGSNVGTGRSIFKQKVGVDLEFNTIRTIDTTIDVDANTGNNTIDIKYFPSADVDNQNQKIINIATPTQTADAATKGYVDGAISGVSSTINLAGDTGTDAYTTGGTLTFAGTTNEIETAVTNDTVTIGLPDNVTIAGDFTLTGASANAVWSNANNRIEFADNAEINFGTSRDLRIYHNGNHSFIRDGGTGSMRIQGSTMVLETPGGTDNYFKGIETGASEIYHNTASFKGKKLETTNTGVQTTGTLNINGAYSFPTADGTPNQILKTDGAGNLTFTTQASTTLGDLGVTATATELNVLDGIPGTLTTTEVGYLDGVTSAIQTQLDAKLPLAGGTMAGGIAMNTQKISGMGDPTAAQDAATKAYVDSQVSGLSSVLTIAGDVGANDTVTVGTDTLTIAGGTNIESTITDNTVTLNLTGTVTDATNAVNSDKINIQTSSDATAYYVTFVDSTSGDEDIYVNTSLQYNPGTDVLSAGTFSGTATQAQYADLAENYKNDESVLPGDVVVIGGKEEIRKYQPGDEFIAGVISTNPAYLMNSEAEGMPVALIGRVPVNCTGPCTKGQPVYAIADGKVSMNGNGPMVGIALETRSEPVDKLVEIMLKI
tara:strand:+ start:1964 stop:4189 length:2226 start_codon:yes stop_codon:yes gene_type:complete